MHWESRIINSNLINIYKKIRIQVAPYFIYMKYFHIDLIFQYILIYFNILIF